MRKPLPGQKTGNKPLLVAVWGLATADPEYFDVFYPSRRVREACDRAGISSCCVFPADLPSFLETPRLNPDRVAFLIRSSAGPAVAAAVEDAGFRAINPSRPLALALDKLETARFLERNGWQTPRTVALAPIPDPGDSRVKAPIPFPAVLKPRFGSRGRGVTLVEDARALANAAVPEECVLQEYVKQSRGRDARFFFAGNRVIAVAERVSPSGALISNASEGGLMRRPDWAEGPAGKAALERWSAQTLEIARASGLWYGSVDYLYAGEETRDTRAGPSLTVCEINGSPGFEALERGLELDIAGPLIDSLAADLGWRDSARRDGN